MVVVALISERIEMTNKTKLILPMLCGLLVAGCQLIAIPPNNNTTNPVGAPSTPTEAFPTPMPLTNYASPTIEFFVSPTANVNRPFGFEMGLTKVFWVTIKSYSNEQNSNTYSEHIQFADWVTETIVKIEEHAGVVNFQGKLRNDPDGRLTTSYTISRDTFMGPGYIIDLNLPWPLEVGDTWIEPHQPPNRNDFWTITKKTRYSTATKDLNDCYEINYRTNISDRFLIICSEYGVVFAKYSHYGNPYIVTWQLVEIKKETP